MLIKLCCRVLEHTQLNYMVGQDVTSYFPRILSYNLLLDTLHKIDLNRDKEKRKFCGGIRE